jgi:hypothetical protein
MKGCLRGIRGDMDQPDKIDCKPNGEVIFRPMRSLQLKSFKNDSREGSCRKISRSRSQISTKKGIDSVECFNLLQGIASILYRSNTDIGNRKAKNGRTR